jgi:hypothetical protein
MFLKLQARLEKHTRRGVTARGVTGEQSKGDYKECPKSSLMEWLGKKVSLSVTPLALPHHPHSTQCRSFSIVLLPFSWGWSGPLLLGRG